MRLGRKTWWLGAGVLLVGGVAALAVRSGGGADEVKGLTVKVQRTDLAIEVVELGRIQPKERVELKSKVAGQVREVLVQEGAAVTKGQVLLRLDTVDFERDVARARAQVELARSGLEYAQLTLERNRRALAERGASQAEVDLATSEVRSKAAAHRLAQVSLSAAEDRLRDTELRSPLDGVVLERNVEPGEVISPGVQATFEGGPLLTVGDLSRLVVETQLNQIDIARVQLGQRVRLTLDALPGRDFEAHVTQVAPAAVKSRSKEVEAFPVEAALSAPDPSLKPGMTADVRISVDTRPGALAAPIEAVLEEGAKRYVLKLARADGELRRERVQVEVGARSDREVELLSGVSEGEELLVDPASSSANEVKL